MQQQQENQVQQQQQKPSVTWQAYSEATPAHAVAGQLLVTRALHGPQLANTRDVLVWVPPSYDQSERRYPVLYMHDGQNLFDAHASFVGEWQVDETLTALSAEGLEALVVGLPNNTERRQEYNPYPSDVHPELNGRGAAYLRFIVDTVKPLIDSTFRTLPGRTTTGIAGSSMGGLISLYGFLTQPDVFGLCGCFSPAYWYGGNRLAQTALELATGKDRVYLDVGTKEGDIFPGMPAPYAPPIGGDPDAEYVEGVRAVKRSLLARGYVEGETLLYVEDPGAPHHESAWARRLPAALRFLLSG